MCMKKKHIGLKVNKPTARRAVGLEMKEERGGKRCPDKDSGPTE